MSGWFLGVCRNLPLLFTGLILAYASEWVSYGRGLAYQVLDQARDVTQRARQQLEDTSCRVRAYVRDEPVKSLLLAAAAGAAVTGLMGWLLRSRRQA